VKGSKKSRSRYETRGASPAPEKARLRHVTRKALGIRWWYNPDRNRRSGVRRQLEIQHHLARKICHDLGVPPVKGALIARCSGKGAVDAWSLIRRMGRGMVAARMNAC
jgi:hypothetical protein